MWSSTIRVHAESLRLPLTSGLQRQMPSLMMANMMMITPAVPTVAFLLDHFCTLGRIDCNNIPEYTSELIRLRTKSRMIPVLLNLMKPLAETSGFNESALNAYEAKPIIGRFTIKFAPSVERVLMNFFMRGIKWVLRNIQ